MLKDSLSEALKNAMRSRDQLVLDTLRMVMSSIKNKEIEKKGDLGDDEVIALLNTLVKQRREAAEMYRKGGREDLADKEESEITVLKGFLPEELSRDEIVGIVDEAVAETGATSMADVGKVMKAVMPKTAGRAEGKLVSEIVREKLS